MVLYEGWKASGVISIQIRGPKNWEAQGPGGCKCPTFFFSFYGYNKRLY